MATSVVVTQIAPLDNDLGRLHIKGTVGGNAFQMTSRNRYFDPVSMQDTTAGANGVASILLTQYNALVAAFATNINSQTVPFAALDNQTISVVYGSTPYAFVGYDTVEVTATVNGQSTVAHFSQDVILEKSGAPGDEGLAAWMSKQMFAQRERNVSWAGLISTFSI